MNSKLLVSFLRKLANLMEDNILTEKQVEEVGKFYMLYKFKNDPVRNYEEEELMKFLSLGWFVNNNFVEK